MKSRASISPNFDPEVHMGLLPFIHPQDVLVRAAFKDAAQRNGQAPIAFAANGLHCLLVNRPAHGWCLAGKSRPAARALARYQMGQGRESPYLHAWKGTADAFAAEWKKQGGHHGGLAARFCWMGYTKMGLEGTEHPPIHRDLKVSPASEADLPVLAANTVQFLREQKPPNTSVTVAAEVKRMRSVVSAGNILVLRKDNEILSQIQIGSDDGHGEAAIGYLYTPPQHRGRGYAHQLGGAALDLMNHSGVRAHVFVDANNLRLVDTYERAGFSTRAMIHRYDNLKLGS